MLWVKSLVASVSSHQIALLRLFTIGDRGYCSNVIWDLIPEFGRDVKKISDCTYFYKLVLG